MKIYVAGKFTERDAIVKVLDKIKELGHEVAYDWTTHKPIKPYFEHQETANQYSQNELAGISKTDVFIYFSHEKGHTLHMEFGAALILKYTTGKPLIYVIGDHQDISPWLFNSLVVHKDTVEEALDEIISKS